MSRLFYTATQRNRDPILDMLKRVLPPSGLVLEFASGELTAARYALNPRNWRYRYALNDSSQWRRFGAEQRASIVEHLWLIERGLGLDATPVHHRRVIPWADSFRGG